MDPKLILENLLNPPVLFFFLGIVAVLLKSGLEIPDALSKFFGMYLMFAIGFKGGFELAEAKFTSANFLTLVACSGMALFVPLYTFFILRLKLDVHNAAAIAATYGSVSAGTFVTAHAFLNNLGLEFDGFLVAGLALMESPAIIIGVAIDRIAKKNAGGEFSWKELLREAFLGGSIFLLVGSLIIGMLTGESGWKAEKPFADALFKGMLSFFLLDMGLVAAKKLKDLRTAGPFLVIFAILVPLANAAIGLGLAKLIGMNAPDALMFMILCASASYIAVGAAMRTSVPEANPSLYLPMSLAVTFPFNVIIGIPLYWFVVQHYL
ncbi:sodium-dependent bicarbonate transport family permease [Leptospira langatensis]|uniref:Sodium-dependent bicarbonate transport family permease n=1 Tax=Leptospira langatensis TaxID=2484983 RepID=A0A5F1ZRR4_9LEPT|nr:sodium-dependent bicarbonate transport family permease [Leptospira langatensis]TGJ98953.1 sodium-dependent bicarbonate transport family permease [Leptospira langatensis]TGL40478.1 sodium-dependent bicarbonate transport family permease [Leptospira langatensis]